MEDLGPDPTPSAADEAAQGYTPSTTRFRARICASGRDVTVRRFPRPDTDFQDAVRGAREIWYVPVTIV